MSIDTPAPIPRPSRIPASVRAWLGLGGVLLLAATLLYLFASRHWGQRIPPGWSWQATFVGIATPPDPDTGEFPDRDVTAIYERRLSRADERGHPRSVSVIDSYINRDPRTGRKIFDYTQVVRIDPRTGRHAQPEFANDHLVFPRNTRQQTYRIRNTYLKGTPFRFEREETIEGVATYVFHYSGPMEYTDFYRGSADTPGLAIPRGQQVRCFDDQFEQTFWVEPATGMIIKIAERCHSFDVLVDAADGAFRGNVLRWSGESSGTDVVARAEEARWQRWRMMTTTRYVPLALLLLGAGLLATGLVRLRTGKDP